MTGTARLLPGRGRPAREPRAEAALGDLRFRALLGEADWAALPSAVRRRFSRRLAGGRTAIYVGEVVESAMSTTGWWIAQAARLIGGPLPTGRDIGVPSVVAVTEDAATGDQIWTRLYGRRGGLPQVIHSAKRFCGPTGLEEHVGRGVGMELSVHVERRALVFRSARYFLQVFGRRITLPVWAGPGALAVTHAETEGGSFLFTLEIVHPLLGPLIRQSAIFRETNPCSRPFSGA